MSVYMIDKDAVLDILQDLRENDPFPEYRTAIREIERMPSVEAEPVVHAHWVKLAPDQRSYFTDYTHCCSECGEWGKKHYKRCRECGAVMDEKMPPEPTPIGKLLFSMRVYKRLKQAGILTMEQLQETDKQILHNIAGLGKQSILEIEEKLAEWKEKNNG